MKYVEALHRLTSLQGDVFDAADACLKKEFDLSLTWYDRLCVLSQVGPSRIHDLAHDIKVTVGGTSKLVDRMADAGFLERRANPADRRSSLIDLTPAGRKMLADAGTALERHLERQFDRALSDEAFAALLSCLNSFRPSTGPFLRAN